VCSGSNSDCGLAEESRRACFAGKTDGLLWVSPKFPAGSGGGSCSGDAGAEPDLGEQPVYSPAQPSKWRFSFTPYAWATGVNGNVTARGHKVNIDESFIDIVKDSDSLSALMGFFEARKGRLSLFTDVVWEDLGFPGHLQRSVAPSAGCPM
jgi:hypothetical protein